MSNFEEESKNTVNGQSMVNFTSNNDPGATDGAQLTALQPI